MTPGFRQSMAWLHTWAGLLPGWILYFVFVTGGFGYYVFEIERWMRPELPAVPAQVTPAAALAVAHAHLQRQAPAAHGWLIQLPGQRSEPHLQVYWQARGDAARTGGRYLHAVLDVQTGAALDSDAVRATAGAQQLYRMHYVLRYVSSDVGIRVVGLAAMAMLVALVAGVITHKKIFSDFFTFRPGKGQRSWLDAHNLVSVTSLPFFLMITYSGLVFFMADYYMPAGVAAVYGRSEAAAEQFASDSTLYPEPAATGVAAPLIDLQTVLATGEATWGAGRVAQIWVYQPGDAAALIYLRARVEGGTALVPAPLVLSGTTGARLPPAAAARSAGAQTEAVLLALHEGRFAGPWLRAAYVLSAVLGCAMIATGLVLWTTKRRVKQDRRRQAGQGTAFGFRLVECLNIATVAGLPVAVAGFFWANRLLPVGWPDRAAWEMHLLFATWGIMFLHAACRAPARAWVEQWVAAALGFGLLPVLTALTTDKHLFANLRAQDWVLAGVDIGFGALAALLGWVAWRVRRRLSGGAAAGATARAGSAAGRRLPSGVVRPGSLPGQLRRIVRLPGQAARLAPGHAWRHARALALRARAADAMWRGQSARHRWRVAGRVVAAVVGGYAVAALLTAALARALLDSAAADRGGAVLVASMPSFLVYLGVMLWAFHTSRVWRVWAVFAGTSAVMGLWLAVTPGWPVP